MSNGPTRDTDLASSVKALAFELGSWHVDPNRNAIYRAGEEKHLENRLMETLVFLSQHKGAVIRRQQFFDAVWHGRVVNDEALSRAISLLRSALGDDASNPAYIKTIPGIGYRLIAPVKSLGQVAGEAMNKPGAPEPSIAVLPFVNLSDDPANEFLSDGISEEIINALVQLPGIKVVGRTSSFAFKGVNDDIRKVGKSLGVTHVLEGSVRTAAGRIRVTAQLLKTEDGFHLWSKNFECELQELFAVQDEIAEGVVRELRLRLLGNLHKARETSADAYSLYLQGLYYLRSGEIAKLHKALNTFHDVTELDPEYAPAWVSLADTYWYLTSYGELARAEAIGLADEACSRALTLDDTLAEAHNCKANLCTAFNRDWRQAKKAAERALELAPGDSRTALQAGNLAITLGNFDEAVLHLKQAISLDPLNLTGHIWISLAYLAMDHIDDACLVIHKALELNPQRVVLNQILTMALLRLDRVEEAYVQIQKEPAGFWHDFGLTVVLYKLGRKEEADASFAGLLNAYADEAPFQIAEIYCIRREPDKAFRWLQRAQDLRDNGLQHLLCSFWLRQLHADQRWPFLLTKLGLSGSLDVNGLQRQHKYHTRQGD